MRAMSVAALLLAAGLSNAQGPLAGESSNELAATLQLPREPRPLPADTQELRFADLFRSPVGRFGLEPSEKLLALNDRKVRIAGYMVRQERAQPGVFMLSARRLATAEVSDGMADDLPPAIVFVHLPPQHEQLSVAYTPVPLLIEGRLSVGPQEEQDGRVSHVRILIDPVFLPTSSGAHTS